MAGRKRSKGAGERGKSAGVTEPEKPKQKLPDRFVLNLNPELVGTLQYAVDGVWQNGINDPKVGAMLLNLRAEINEQLQRQVAENKT